MFSTQTEDRTETLAIQYETTLKPALAGKKKGPV